MAEPRRRIGIMGGTFDPIHYGHLAAAQEAWAQFGMEKVIFIPCGRPAHKKDYEVTPAGHRHAMVVLATQHDPRFEVSREELDRPGPSYAVDTVRALRCKYTHEVELYFITGADAVREILTWRQPQQLVEMCELVACTRPGHDLGGLEEAVGPELFAQVHPLEIPGVNISSTQLRQRVEAGLPLKYLTPEPVEAYIAQHHLYRKQQHPVSARSGSDCAGGKSRLAERR